MASDASATDFVSMAVSAVLCASAFTVTPVAAVTEPSRVARVSFSTRPIATNALRSASPPDAESMMPLAWLPSPCVCAVIVMGPAAPRLEPASAVARMSAPDVITPLAQAPESPISEPLYNSVRESARLDAVAVMSIEDAPVTVPVALALV